MEESEEPIKSDWNVLLRIILSVLGFILSVVYLLCGLFMLVRFWLITDFYYLLYVCIAIYLDLIANLSIFSLSFKMISTILIGTIFNIYSCNLFLYTEEPVRRKNMNEFKFKILSNSKLWQVIFGNFKIEIIVDSPSNS